jgi:hypothetical protein
MGPFLHALQNSAFSAWVVGSESIWAYPMILTMHTVGLGIVVGAAVIVDLRLLGVGPAIPLEEVKRVFPDLLVGFLHQPRQRVMLFVSEAEDKATQPVFLIKLLLIAIGVVVTARIATPPVRCRFAADAGCIKRRTLAITSLVVWGGAIVAGRLMAYLK